MSDTVKYGLLGCGMSVVVFVCVVLGFILVSQYLYSQPTQLPTPTSTLTPTREPTLTNVPTAVSASLSEGEYLNRLHDISEKYTTVLALMGTDDGSGIAILGGCGDIWKLGGAVSALGNMGVPPRFQAAHLEMERASKFFDHSCDLFVSGIVSEEPNKVRLATEELNKAIESIRQATDLLQ